MKNIAFTLVVWSFLLLPQLVAEEIPFLWLEAGKENVFQTIAQDGPINWTLRFEHRTLDSGLSYEDKPSPRLGLRTLKIKTPPLKTGITMRTKLVFNNVPYRDVIIASPEPFEDKKTWGDIHPIALYDPEKKTTETFDRAGITYKNVKSYQEINALRSQPFGHAVPLLIVGENIDFERAKGLAELLRTYSEGGGSVLVLSPRLGDGIPLQLDDSVRSLTLTDDTKYFFPLATGHFYGDRWTLRPSGDQITLSGKTILPYKFADEVSICRGYGPSILDIRFAHPLEATGNSPSLGRIVFMGKPIVSRWAIDIESRYYFKSLVERLSDKGVIK